MKHYRQILLFALALALSGCAAPENTTEVRTVTTHAVESSKPTLAVTVQKADDPGEETAPEAGETAAETAPSAAETEPAETFSAAETLPEDETAGSVIAEVLSSGTDGSAAADPEEAPELQAGSYFPADEESEIGDPAELLAQAEERTAALTAKEEQFLIYSRYETGRVTEESVNMKFTAKGLDTDMPDMSCVGMVKTGDQLLDLELYYRDGMLYRSSGTVKRKAPADPRTALAGMDLLKTFLTKLTPDLYSGITCETTADGKSLIRFAIEGTIEEAYTTGTGELLVNPEGIISSRSYSLCAESPDGTVRQSVESTLLSADTDVPEIEFPAFDLYQE